MSRGEVGSRSVWGFALLGLALAAYAHRGLITLGSSQELSGQVENLFFEPSEAAAPVVLGLSLWLLHRRWKRLARLEPRPGPLLATCALLGAGLGFFLWSQSTRARDLEVLSLVFHTLGIANWLAGPPAMRVVAVPVGVLLLAIPIPPPLLNVVLWRLQVWTADYTGLLLYLLGVPAFVSGDQIVTSGRLFAIIETCSGLRSMETLLMLAVLMTDLFRRRGLHAVLIVVAAPFVAFAINGLRAVAIIFNPHGDVAAVHTTQGVLMLLGGVLVLYGMDALLERFLAGRKPPVCHVPPVAPSGRLVPPRLRPRLIGVMGLLLGLVALSFWTPRVPIVPVRMADAAQVVAMDLGDWRGTDVEVDRMFLGRVGADHMLQRGYRRGNETLDVFIASARFSRYRSILSPKTALPGGGWIIEERGHARHDDGREVEELVVRRGTRRLLVHHWRDGAMALVDDTLRTLLALDASPWRREGGMVVIRLATPLGATLDPAPRQTEQGGAATERIADLGALRQARARLAGFAALLRPTLEVLGTPGRGAG